MSSLRLALKQSLEDAPPAAITTTTATTTTTAEDAASVASSSSSSSSENEASLHDLHGDDDDDDDDDEDESSSSSELHRQKQHVAAHKIQNQYRKNKKPIRTKKNQQKKATKRAEKASKTMKKMHHNNDDDQSSHSSSTNTTPVNTVPSPSQHRIAHMHSLSVEDCRRHVCVGLRVKVQFDSSEWYGGRVSAVSKGDRNRIRIRYDDGTTEIATFPDRNNNNSQMDAIVVDEQDNGRHAEAARNASEFFEPKSITEDKSIYAPDDDGEEEGELMESPTTKSKQIATMLQKHQVAAAPTSPRQRLPVEVIQSNHVGTENSITASSVPLQIPKKKRGRPPKHPRPEITVTGSTDNMTITTTTMTGTGAALPDSKTEASTSMNVSSVSRLNIRIPNRNKVVGSPKGGDTPHTAGESAAASPLPIRKSADHSQQSMNANIDSSTVQRKRKQGDIIAEEKQSQPENPAPIKKLIIKIPKEKVKKNLQEEHASVTYAQKQREGGGDTPRNKIKIKKSFSSDDAFVVKSPRSPNASSMHPQMKAEEHMVPSSSGSPRASKKTKVAHISSPTSKASPKSRKKTLSATATSSMDIDIEVTTKSPAETHPHRHPQEQATPKSFSPSSTEPGIVQVCSSPIEGNKADHAMDDGYKEQGSSKFTETNVSDAKESGPPMRFGSTSSNLAMQEGNQNAETVSFPTPHLPESQKDNLEPTTPLHSTLSAEDFSFEGIVRSERQAAQKANERIVAKHDAAQESPIKKKKKRRKDGEVIGDDLPKAPSTSSTHLAPQTEDESQWVQCDSCGKWRIIPGSVVKNLPKQWYCSDNIHDPKRATCEAPEQTAKDILREKKRMKKRQQKLLEKAAAAEAAAGIEKNVLVGSTPDVSQPLLEKTESDSAQPLKKKVIDHARSPRPSKPEKTLQKPKRARTPVIDEMGASDSSNQKPDKKLTLGKKGRSVENFEKVVQADSEVVVKRGRGRPRGSRTTKESSAPTAPVEDAENLEWVQCEKCEKWRKLPPHISADELPDVWYCELNTWNPSSASCEAPEDKAEGVLDVGGFGNSGVSAGKLTYRNLIFGSTGRKPNRPISEKMRAAESLFSTGLEEDEAPSRVLYADSSAYVSRGRPNLVNENDGRLVLEMMSRSFLWQELKNTQRMMNHVQPATLTFETIPPELQQPLREYLLHILGKYTLTGDEVVEQAQSMEAEILRDEYKKVQPYCTKNVVITALCELVKDGSVECIQKIGVSWTMQDWKPLFRRALRKTPVVSKHLEPPSVRVHSLSRCMKISKPWKLAKTW